MLLKIYSTNYLLDHDFLRVSEGCGLILSFEYNEWTKQCGEVRTGGFPHQLPRLVN